MVLPLMLKDITFRLRSHIMSTIYVPSRMVYMDHQNGTGKRREGEGEWERGEESVCGRKVQQPVKETSA